MVIVMGDLNAKVGDDNEGYEAVMGREGLGDMNDNGERFADFCDLQDLVIGGSVFPHKKITYLSITCRRCWSLCKRGSPMLAHPSSSVYVGVSGG